MNKTDAAKAQLSTVKSKYDQAKDGTNKALREADKPLDPKDQGTLESDLPVNADDLDKDMNNVKAFQTLSGLAGFSPKVDGNEGFMDTVKETVTWLLRRASDILNWVLDYTMNRVSSLRRKITRLKYSFNDNGIKLKDTSYPRSVIKLAVKPNIPSTPEFAVKTLDEAQRFYNRMMSQQTQIASLTRAFPSDITREQLLNFSDSLSTSYISGMGGKRVKDNLYEIHMPSGFQTIKAMSNPARGFNGFTLSEYFLAKISPVIPDTFTPSADVVQRLILKLDVCLMDVEKSHKSQRSFANNFKRTVQPLADGVKLYPEKTKDEILKYYRWLVNYQQKTVAIPLNYYLSVISASVDLCNAQVHVSK
ncbi:hypothetical protein FDJ25_gp113 [Vibrio phage Aphrodite1]|uniref:Uncharacterized protein n=1 Tax=Vibrio phage Aphrodite1 TaxID=2070057 RepID=A0A2I7QHW5_9CAUD|nr:hypothetical protein FDJ25_gp113 [Vibrio phage Aphrodite1]AUR80979.1 hypothetical protein Aphrodite1_0090 [Vibrio phage Aphrodite1]